VNLITIQWGRIPCGAGRLIILQTDFDSRYFSTLQGGDLHSPGYLKSWEVNSCGGSRLGPLIHGWYIKCLYWRKVRNVRYISHPWLWGYHKCASVPLWLNDLQQTFGGNYTIQLNTHTLLTVKLYW